MLLSAWLAGRPLELCLDPVKHLLRVHEPHALAVSLHRVHYVVGALVSCSAERAPVTESAPPPNPTTGALPITGIAPQHLEYL